MTPTMNNNLANEVFMFKANIKYLVTNNVLVCTNMVSMKCSVIRETFAFK